MMKFNFLIAFLLFSLQAFSQITGEIRNAQTGNPVTGAHVALYYSDGTTIADQTISGKKGDFIFSGYYKGDLSVSVSHLGFELYEAVILESSIRPVHLEVELKPAIVPMGEIRVSALRLNKTIKNVPLPMAMITKPEMDKLSGFTTPDMLENEPGVSLSRDGIWATSVNIRGLTEQRIVVLIDGNRIETATDIAAGLAMIDVNDIERVEVIKGASSSLYGTGAMGGVVNIITRDGHYGNGLFAEGSVSGSYQSANSMHSENVSVTTGSKKWFFRASASYRDAQNTMTPEGELENSQFTDNNISLKLGAKPFINHELKLDYQRFFAKDVGIPGGSSFPGPATATYPQELRDMFSAKYSMRFNNEIVRNLSIKYYHQYILRDVILKPNAAVTITPSGYHTTDGLQIQSTLTSAPGHSLIAGIDLWQRDLETEREKTIIKPVTDTAGNVTGTTTTIVGEVPIPDALFASGGFYLQDEFRTLNDRMKVILGGRFDMINIQNDKAVDPLYLIVNGTRNNEPPTQRITFDAENIMNYSWSANLGLIYDLGVKTDLTANFSRAFRSPSIEERYKYINLGASVNIGDPGLEPEEGYFFDLGIRHWGEKFHFVLNGFLNSMDNLIVAQPGEVIYGYSYDPAQQDTLPALINANVDKALLYGFDLSADYNIYDGFVLFGNSSFVRGVDRNNETDLPLIPPFTSRLGVRYQIPEWFGVELEGNFVNDQKKIAEGETETKGYASYDLRIYSEALSLGIAKMHLFAGIDNITNRAYINHLATNRGFIKYEPGRNFYLKVRFEF